MSNGGIRYLCNAFVCLRLEIDAGRYRLCTDYFNNKYDNFKGNADLVHLRLM